MRMLLPLLATGILALSAMSHAAPLPPSTTVAADDAVKKETPSHARTPHRRIIPGTDRAVLPKNDNEGALSRGKNGQFRKKEKNTVIAPETSGATAHCRDGSLSHSQQHRGACSRHGGVDQWLNQ